MARCRPASWRLHSAGNSRLLSESSTRWRSTIALAETSRRFWCGSRRGQSKASPGPRRTTP
eukprot:1739976-Lingulodinium_polyedra.AAC.1